MATPAAPRIDDRLRAFILDAAAEASAADVTRQVGELAWSLGLPRPSYQRVRLLIRGRQPTRRTVSTPAPGAAHYAMRTLDFAYQYPGPGMRDWYRRYSHGMG